MTTAGTTPAKAPFAQYDVRATVDALIAARGNNAEAATALGISTRAMQWRVGRLDTDERKRLDALAIEQGWPTAEARKVAGLAKARSVGGLQALLVDKAAYAFVDTAPLGVVEELHRRTSARLEAERAAATPRDDARIRAWLEASS